jgi:peptide/nickel transport system permease protein
MLASRSIRQLSWTSSWRTVKRLRGTGKLGLICATCFLGLMVLAAFVMPLPHNPLAPTTYTDVLRSPNSTYWFGTDSIGLDVFSRTIAAASHDLPLAILGTIVSIVLGVPLGLFAASGHLGERFMRVLDIIQALPTIVIIIVIVTLTGGGARNIILALAIVNIPRFARLVRGEALSLREARFVEAAVAIGCSRTRVMLNHVLRNAYGIVLVHGSQTAASSIVLIAATNFLGVGFAPPEPTWGSMIQAGAQNMAQGAWWPALFPGVAVFIAVVCFNLIADGLEHIFDPSVR